MSGSLWGKMVSTRAFSSRVCAGRDSFRSAATTTLRPRKGRVPSTAGAELARVLLRCRSDRSDPPP